MERSAPYEVGWVSAAAAMFPRAVLDRVGLLDESFTHWVDADWCLRIKQAGWRAYCVPGTAIFHLEGYGRGKKAPRSIVAFHKGAYRLYRKHYVASALSPAAIVASVGLAARCAWLLLSNALKKREAPAAERATTGGAG
jgi:GT2 family glycosyltransferase